MDNNQKIFLEGMCLGAAIALACVYTPVTAYIKSNFSSQTTNSTTIVSKYHPVTSVSNGSLYIQMVKNAETGLVEKVNGGKN